MASPDSTSEERGVTLAEAKAGLKFQSGHAVRLVIGDVTVPARAAQPAEGAAASSPLSHATWDWQADDDGPTYRHGETARMQVRVQGHEGARVSFVVERMQGGAWEPIATKYGTVSGGVAWAQVRVQHPGGRDHAHLRFRSELA